jgi:dUTP pyrophosphatase
VSPTPFAYLAHPIDLVEDARRLTEKTCYLMQQNGLAAYIPSYAFKIPAGAAPNEVLNRINRAALTECDALIAILPKVGQTSFGVFYEIEQARAEGKPTLIVGSPELWARSWAMPKTDQVVFTDEMSHNSLQALRTVMLMTRRARRKPPGTQAMYVRLDDGASLPSRAYKGDAGFDLYALEETTIGPGEFVDVPMGCAVQLPDNVWAMITGRSSTVRKHDLLVTTGIIDTGYRGPLFAGVRSLRTDPYTVKKGERLAQLIPFPNVAATLHATPVSVLSGSDRGEAGFGSSGA